MPVSALVQLIFILSSCKLSFYDSTKEFQAAYANDLSENWS